MDAGFSQSHFMAQAAVLLPDSQDPVSAMFSKFADLLDHGLNITTSKIKGDIKANLQN